jgi:hypothetical protein
MKKYTLYLFCFFAVCCNCTKGQSSYDDQNSVATPSANNDFLKSQPDFNIYTYTGTAKIEFPLYSLASKLFTIPISMVYNSAGGIRVQDYAGFAGLGWRLNAGGYISRVVMGLPDEQTKGFIGTSGLGQTIRAGLNQSLIEQIGQDKYDGEPDQFTLTTPFFAVRFILDQNGNPVFANSTGFRITHNLYKNANYQNGTNWVVTDDDGNQYFFGTAAASREDMTTKMLGTSTTFTSTWYLDKIVAFNSRDVITFSYTAGTNYTQTHYFTSSTAFQTGGPCSVGGPNPLVSSDSNVYTYNSPKYISKIETSLGEVDFGYVFDRQDVANEGRLALMTVYASAGGSLNVSKSYQFNYGYFGTSSDPYTLRLKLDNITLYGKGGSTLVYKSFDYYASANLPSRKSVEFDYWGFYNTNTSGTAISPVANKNPDASRTQANILTGVHDLSGEVQHIEYELNTYYTSSGNVTAGGLRVHKISKVLPTGETLYTQYDYNDDNGHSTGQIYTYVGGDGQRYTTSSTNFSKNMVLYVPTGSGGCLIGAKNTSSETPFSGYDLNGNLVGYSSVKMLYQNGGYEVYAFTNFSDFPDYFSYNNTAGRSFGYDDSRQLSVATSFAYKRGLLTSKTVYTAAGKKIIETLNTYMTLDQVAGQGIGVRVSPLIVAGNTVVNWVYGTYSSYSENYLLTSAIDRNYDQNDQGLYQEVVSNYTYASNHRLIHRIDYTDSKGLARNKTFYYTGDAGIPLVNGNESYAINGMLNANNTNTLIHTTETHNQSTFHTHYSYVSLMDASQKPKYLLAAKKTYNNNSDVFEEQQYQYDLTTCNLTAVNKIGGPVLSTLYGYNNTYIVAKVRNALNSTSTVVSSAESSQYPILDNNSNRSVVLTFTVDYAGSVNFRAVPTGGSLEATVSVSMIGPSYYSGTICISTMNTCGSNNYLLTIPNVQPGTYSCEMSLTVNGSYPSTQVNALVTYPQYVPGISGNNEFFYEGFEFSGNAAATPYAGKGYHSGIYQVPFAMPNSRSYQIDYHYLSGGTWHAVTKAYTNYMTLNDGSAVDEVRVYPVGAEMTSYTYDPLNGISSQCDARNRFTFYEYDNFGRLETVRDNDGNILNTYEYQYHVAMP